MLRIQKTANGEVVLTVSGRLSSENLSEVETLLRSERNGRRTILDLRDLTLADRDAVRFLARCETDSIELRNCPAFVREWITRERGSG